jgi:hypothetical protein
MKTIIKSLTRELASNLNPAERGAHFHAGPAGAYPCTDDRCVRPGSDARRER